MGIEQITIVDPVWYYWILFIFAAIIGSVASSLVNHHGRIRMCGWECGELKGKEGDLKEYHMGFIADIIIGIAAALGILWSSTPQTILQLIGLGAISGYGGSSVLRALVNKLDAQVHQREAEKNKLDAQVHQREAEKNKLDAQVHQREAEKNKIEAEKHREEADDNKAKADSHQIEADGHQQDTEKNKNELSAIKDYLLETNKEVLRDLYNKNIIS